MSNCLVTGGAGFIGSQLVEQLIALGHSVWAIDAFTKFYSRARKESNIRALRQCSRFHLSEADLCETVDLPGVPIDYVFHLAAQPGVRTSWGSSFRDHANDNILATQRLLDAISIRPEIPVLVFASSSSVYGNGMPHASREDDPINPLSPYAVSKVAAEFLCRSYAQAFSIPICILRLFTVYGPRQRPDMALAIFLQSILDGSTVPIYGSLDQQRDYTYVGDVVDAMIAAATRGVAGTINVGGGTPITMAECVRCIETVTGRRLRFNLIAPQPGEARRTSADPARAIQLLSFRPSVTFSDGLAAQWQSLECH